MIGWLFILSKVLGSMFTKCINFALESKVFTKLLIPSRIAVCFKLFETSWPKAKKVMVHALSEKTSSCHCVLSSQPAFRRYSIEWAGWMQGRLRWFSVHLAGYHLRDHRIKTSLTWVHCLNAADLIFCSLVWSEVESYGSVSCLINTEQLDLLCVQPSELIA